MPVRKLKPVILIRLIVLMTLLLPVGLASGEQGSRTAQSPEERTGIEAATNTIALSVISARDEPLHDNPDGSQGITQGTPITEYQFMINIDNTGDPLDETGCNPYLEDGVTRNPDYPDNCNLPGIRTVPAWAPIYIQGDETLLNSTATLTLPDGKYLISVTADGFKLDGVHFSVPTDDGEGDGVATLEVGMHPFPLPPASMVIQVFEDSQMTNGQFDAGSENGLAGFRASINDIAGEITTDLYGNPLCTTYITDPDTGEMIVDVLGTGCYSDADGLITIPNIGPIRYDVLIFPPAGETWIQTTTLEGSHGWDTWLQEGGTGLDNEFLIAAEPAPWTLFGFVRPTQPPPDWTGTGSITGVIMGAATYIPSEGGLPYQGGTWAGYNGSKLHRPIANPWLSLNDLQRGDVSVWVGQGNADGSFEITGVPDGNYFLCYWDENQHYILDFVQVTVSNGEATDIDVRMLTGWFTEMYGTVFHDFNSNGKQDPGEPGVPNYTVVLKDRDNTEIDRMSILSTTDTSGAYELEKGYPMGSWMILEAYSDLYHTTGITYQTLNMTSEVTLLGPIVDIGVLPVLGQPVRVDLGVHPYDLSENGGNAGTVIYDTVRAEDEARYA
ncbi:MAG: SdrD B-like domain-containing protein, partial [Desulforhabdus sp.]|nr:SdrD B-like domain-containing protein [Desulforhabdus sp.]